MKRINQKPLVSVIMPVFNAGKFVSEAIESILNQTYRNFELIIIDDASTDNSWEIIESFKKKYPRKIRAFRLVKNVNKGGDAVGNIGYTLARGGFIARMDADDVSEDERLEKQVSYMVSHPKCTILGSSATVIDSNGKVLGEKITPQTHADIYKDYFVFHPMIHPSVLIRRSKIGKGKKLYKLDYFANNDYLTFFEMISKGLIFANLPDKLLRYRMHGKNDSLVNVKEKFRNSLKIRFRAIREYGYKPSLMGVVKLFLQVIVMNLFPERAIVPTYLIVRGITKPSDYFSFSLVEPFVKLRKVLLHA